MNGTGPEKRDLVLAPQEYCYLQDETRGIIKTFVGPIVVNQTAQDRPVKFDPKSRQFGRVNLEQAVCSQPMASEGDYIVLENPAKEDKRPDESSQQTSPPLMHGRKINIPGPCTFALWPGQTAAKIAGHNLRSNQYLVVRIYNDNEAKKNWSKAVIKPVDPTDKGGEKPEDTKKAEADILHTEVANLTIGQLIVVKGTDVSFYIPPTGVEVVPDNSNYVREAITLERLEYCILVDENGKKRFERGPQVVFPKPTEHFYADDEGSTKFRAIELNPLQGIHVKVIEAYEEGDKKFKEGEELFIKGDTCAIYFPRTEHSLITYDAPDGGKPQKKHYAVAIPAGEGRYVMNRNTGEIRTEKGPKMLLCDPRSEVIVRRILSEKQCRLWYPGNSEALAYNQKLLAMMETSPSGRSGFVTEAQARSVKGLMGGAATRAPSAALEAFGSALQSGDMAMDEFRRGSTFTQPRQLTLNTKYEGVPAINVWTGYAVMVVDKSGNRRVEQGPCTVLMNYDETMEVLQMSTGKPKTTDKLEETVYLRTANNKVSDIIDVETKDHVPCQVKISMRVNFEGESKKWFDVENYVKLLCDHVRSLLKSSIRKIDIQTFYANSVDLVRDIILGEKPEKAHRPGLTFPENGIAVKDVDVLGTNIANAEINSLLTNHQFKIISGMVNVNQAEVDLKNTVRHQEIQRTKASAEAVTVEQNISLQRARVQLELALAVDRAASELKTSQERRKVIEAEIANTGVQQDADLAHRKAQADQKLAEAKADAELFLARLKEETESVVKRFGAAQPGFAEALTVLGNKELVTKVAEAMSVQQFVGGKNLVDVITKVFDGSTLGPIMAGLMAKAGGSLESMTDGKTAVPVRR